MRAGSWPQAASMSSPRVLRVTVVRLAFINTSRKRSIVAGAERSKRPCGNGLYGIRFTLAGTPSRILTSSCAWVTLSLTPASMTYSLVTRASLAQAFQTRPLAGGAEGDAPPRQAIGHVIQHDFHGHDRVVEVQQRLAHAHHHDIGNDALALRVAPERAVGGPHLADNLVRVEVAIEALGAGGAERATERGTQ